MVERGIYDLSTWVAGLWFLPPTVEVPVCFKELGFDQIPAGAEDVQKRYWSLAKQRHPDAGGSVEDFKVLKEATEAALKYLQSGEKINTRPE
ncbi:hypothetical protein [Sporomusa sp. KB1]|uniref:hypothetical protein n=1 Tax=Sporomusa sp. KB1 TaxID=943346 RepID=UPI0011A77A8D|nr:hypothetical protein [Sporomusa sp. KB1]TWH46224.1 hypothetical protein Salpa_2189 [Sporomusa sp. KB1]